MRGTGDVHRSGALRAGVPILPQLAEQPEGTHSRKAKGKSLLQVQTLSCRGVQRAPPPAKDPTRGPAPARLLGKHPDAVLLKLLQAAWAYLFLSPRQSWRAQNKA